MKQAAADAPAGTARLVFDLARPYRGWFITILQRADPTCKDLEVNS
jgi:hypothetical protein